MALTTVAAEVYRDFELDGVPSSGVHEPKKPDIRRLLGGYERVINAFTSTGGLIYSSKVLMDADLSRPANSMAWVLGDAAVGNNGVYQKSGAAGAGSWARVADLPYSFAVGTDAGEGTANAIEVSTNIPVSDSVIVSFVLAQDTTSVPVSVSFNGGPALTLKSNRGNNASALSSGMEIWGRMRSSDGTFRLVTDQDVSALVAQAEAAAAAALAAASSVDLPVLSSGDAGKTLIVKPDSSGYLLSDFPPESVAKASAVAMLKALSTAASEIAYLNAGGRAGFFALRAGSPPVSDTQEGEFISSDTTGFYWERVGRSGIANAQHFGAIGDGASDNAAVINAMITAGYKTIYLPSRTPAGAEANYRFNAQVIMPGGVAIVGDRCRTKISMAAAMSVDLFSVRGVGNSLTNIECIGNNTQTNWLIRLQTNLGNVSYFWADNVYTTNCNGFIADANSTGIATNITVTNFGHRQPTGRFCLLYDCFAFIFFIKGFADYVGVTAASTNVPIVGIVGNQGAIFENFDVLGGTITGMSARTAFYVENSEAVWFRRCMGDTMGGHAFFATGSSYVYLDNCTGSLCDNHQFNFASCVYVILTNFYAGGRQGIGGAAASKHGISITGGGPVNINGGVAKSNTGRGVSTDGTSPVVLMCGITLNGNGVGNYALTGSFSHLCMSQLASGALVTSATGTAG